jgi:hypothetical protein
MPWFFSQNPKTESSTAVTEVVEPRADETPQPPPNETLQKELQKLDAKFEETKRKLDDWIEYHKTYSDKIWPIQATINEYDIGRSRMTTDQRQQLNKQIDECRNEVVRAWTEIRKFKKIMDDILTAIIITGTELSTALETWKQQNEKTQFAIELVDELKKDEDFQKQIVAHLVRNEIGEIKDPPSELVNSYIQLHNTTSVIGNALLPQLDDLLAHYGDYINARRRTEQNEAFNNSKITWDKNNVKKKSKLQSGTPIEMLLHRLKHGRDPWALGN